MICEECGSGNTYVIDSRETTPTKRRRRYKCNHCGARFTTYELTRDAILDLEATVPKEILHHNKKVQVACSSCGCEVSYVEYPQEATCCIYCGAKIGSPKENF